MFFKPKWYRMLPYHLKPKGNKVEKLEALRIRLDFSHRLFMTGIANSRWAVIKAQEATLKRLKINMPNATDKELWKGVLFTRLEVKLKTPSPYDPPADIILHKMEAIDNIIAGINSFAELIDYILQMEAKNLDDSDIIQRQIDEMLAI